MWIITSEVNDYNQYGKYFVGAFIDKPTFEQLRNMFPYKSEEDINHLLTGGGRRGYENDWFNLEQVEEGVDYSED